MNHNNCTGRNSGMRGYSKILESGFKKILSPKIFLLKILLLILFGGFFNDAKAEHLPVKWNNVLVPCDDTINGSLDQECKFIISGAVLIEPDTLTCPCPLTVLVRYNFSDTLAIGNIDNLSDTFHVRNAYQYLNQFLTAEVFDNAGTRYCEVVIRVEDKLAPQLTCNTLQVNCNADTSAAAIGFPLVVENCDQNVTLSRLDQFIPLDCTNPLGRIGAIARTWIAIDASGNRDTCTQTIFLLRADTSQVTIAPMVILPCTNPDTTPANTGYPLLDGVPMSANAFCNLWVVRGPTVLIDSCDGAEKKFLRTWFVNDNCISGAVKELNQTIEIRDTTPAVVTCQDTIFAGTDPGICTGTILLPNPVITDDCSTSFTIDAEITGVGTGFGPHPNLLPGVYDVIYRVRDCSDSVSVCSSVLLLEDTEEPTAICREFTVVSLNSTGIANVPAQSFDEESYDNCDNIGFLASRDGINFTPTVRFDCSDLADDSIMVVLRVYEQSRPDVFADCMVMVDVQDKLRPIINCPPNRIVDCSFDFSNLAVLGSPTVIEPCPYTLTDTTIFNLNQCGVGTVLRIFKATDSSGNMGICTQTITVENQSPFNLSMIQWPPDTTFNTCNPDLNPNNLPPPYNRPRFTADSCAMVVVGHTDDRFDVSFPACYKIFRKWTVMDWCTNQQWTHVQKLIVMDNTSPVITCPGNITAPASANCTATMVTIPPATATDCDPNVKITNNSPYATSGGADASGVYPVGTTIVTFTARDNCGNFKTCTTRVTVSDQTAPTLKVINQLAIELGRIGNVVDATLFATAFNTGSFDNCTAKADLKFTIRHRDPSATTPPTTTSLTYTCDDIGLDTVEVWVMDLAGNSEFVIVTVDVQDNFMNFCGSTATNNRTATISGTVKTESGKAVAGTTLKLSGGANKTAATNADGYYEFKDLEKGKNYTVTPEKNTDLLDGVTTFDLVLISKHILNEELLNSPFKVISGDVNNSHGISTFDLIALRKAILRIEDHFPNNASWKFVKKGFVFSDPSNPMASNPPRSITVSNLDKDTNGLDFTATKVGDVNGNASGNLDAVDDRETPLPVAIHIPDQEFERGEIVNVNLSVAEAREFFGWQGVVQFDPDKLELAAAKSEVLERFSDENFGWLYAPQGLLTLSWHQPKATQLEPGKPFATLSFRAKADGKLSESLNFANNPVEAEWYGGSGELNRPEFVFEDSKNSFDRYELLQNRPNPFEKFTVIGFKLPEATGARLKIFDLSGKVVKTLEGNFEAGSHEFRLMKKDFPQSGVFFYQLETPKFTATKKLILL